MIPSKNSKVFYRVAHMKYTVPEVTEHTQRNITGILQVEGVYKQDVISITMVGEVIHVWYWKPIK